MSLSGEKLDYSLRVTKRMISKGVTGSHHKQPQTIAGWFAVHEQGRVKDAIDAMAKDRDVPLRKKGRGTVTLTSIQDGKEYLKDNGTQPPTTW